MLRKSTPHQDQADLGGSNSPASNYPSRFDMWLLRRLYASLGDPQIGITMGGRLKISHRPSSGRYHTIHDRPHSSRMLLDPQLGLRRSLYSRAGHPSRAV